MQNKVLRLQGAYSDGVAFEWYARVKLQQIYIGIMLEEKNLEVLHELYFEIGDCHDGKIGTNP